MNAAKKFVAFIAAKKKYLAQVALGQGIWATTSWLYDNPLYIAAIAIYGPIYGGGMMTLGSLAICLLTLIWYNRTGVDWVGVGAIDSIRALSLKYAEKLARWKPDSLVGMFLVLLFYIPIRIILFLTRLANHSKHGDVIAFVLLSILQDPFITTAYLRHGKYGSMKRRDWWIFFGSVVVSNGYWILRTTIIIEIALVLWKSFS